MAIRGVQGNMCNRAFSKLLASQSSFTVRKHMSSNAKVWLNKDTRVICQGFTGKQGALGLGVVMFLKVCELPQVLFLWRKKKRGGAGVILP